MLYSLTANKESFHPVEFHKGLNLILGVRATGSGAQDTCNSLGKSTLLRIIDFCLGSDVDKHGCLSAGKLPEWEFTLELDVASSRVKVTRSTDAPDLIDVTGDVSNWPVQPDVTRSDGVHQFGIEKWRMLLGCAFFKLPSGPSDAPSVQPPTYRQLFAYVYRKSFEKELYPVAQFKTAERDRSITYLMGLEWEFLSRMADIVAKHKDAKAIQEAAKVKIKAWNTKIVALRTECRALRSELETCKAELDTFKVDPEYHRYEEEASKRTDRIHELRNRIVADKRTLRAAQTSYEDESSNTESVISLYESARSALGESVKRQLREVQEFHEAISRNRKEFLDSEIVRLKEEIQRDEEESRRLDNERAEYLQHLKSAGALEEFVALQNTYLTKMKVLDEKELCIRDWESSRDDLSAAKEEKKQVLQDAKNEFDNRAEIANSAESHFNEIIQEFYGAHGTLGLEFVESGKSPGFRFALSVPSSDGTGIGKMSVFAFDLMLFLQGRARNLPVNLLMHDGELFASSDLRQTAVALEMAHKQMMANDGQYITGMNEDKLPLAQFAEHGFDYESCIALKLQDGAREGKLLGIEF